MNMNETILIHHAHTETLVFTVVKVSGCSLSRLEAPMWLKT